ncbi:MAG: SDR family NAD(P)-dependent oxidoreductase [Burkholderiales bacterium]|nr:SDR family NAD(P)-dependent oxidoreductase [Burkholderiales bacterium]
MSALADKVVIVTGAAGNLGQAVARAAHAAGAKTVLVDQSAEQLQQVYGGTGPDASRMISGGVDLADEGSARALAASVRARFGRIDVLVNTVGGFRGGKHVHEEELATWDLMMTVNLRTALLACRAVIPLMLEQGAGAIVNVGAGAALAAPAGLAAYSAAKSAVLRLTESLAAEVKAKGLRVNAVLPSTIDTPQNRAAMPDADTSKWVPPDAIADVIVFLASDAARAVNGVALPVFGRA